MTIAQEHGFGFSPTNSSPDTNMGSMLFDDDSKDFGDDDSKPKKAFGRKGPGAADKRATHNAIERARRESLNGRFMTLAEALPSMANVKRPSKSIIVNKALDFVFDAQVKEHVLIKENNDLRRQVDQLRARLGMAPLPPPTPLPAAVDIPKAASYAQYPRSFTSAEGAFQDEISASMGSINGGASTGSPASEQQIASPTSVHGASPAFTESSPTISYPPLYPTSLDGPDPAADQRRPSSAPLSSPPFQHLGMSGASMGGMNAQAQAMLQAQFGYMNPSVLSQQHSLLIAAHLQQQQQMQQHQHGHDVYGMGGMGGMGGVQGQQGGMPWAGFGAMDAYSFMS